LSLNSPRTGENKNCINANETINIPPHADAALNPSPVSSSINDGKTGIIIHNPIISTITVMNIKIRDRCLIVMATNVTL